MNKNKIVISAVILGALILGGLAYFQKYQDRNLVYYKDMNLPAEDMKIFEDRLAKAQTTVDGFNDNTNAKVKHDGYMALGFAHFALGNLKDARDAVRAAIDIESSLDGPWSTLAEINVQIGDYKEASRAYQTALLIEPRSADYWVRYLLIEKEHLGANEERMHKLYGEALAKTGRHINILVSYARYLESTGDLEKALTFWREALNAKPENTSLYEPEIQRIEALIQQSND